jgi:hypothetical protein
MGHLTAKRKHLPEKILNTFSRINPGGFRHPRIIVIKILHIKEEVK